MDIEEEPGQILFRWFGVRELFNSLVDAWASEGDIVLVKAICTHSLIMSGIPGLQNFYNSTLMLILASEESCENTARVTLPATRSPRVGKPSTLRREEFSGALSHLSHSVAVMMDRRI